MNGQLWSKERQFLYDAVIIARPPITLEVGTWKGGGSTWQIATALSKLGFGRLHTCETNPEFYEEAQALYLHSNTNVNCWPRRSTELIQLLINQNEIPKFVFFDGPEDPDLNLSDFELLDKHLEVGSYFCMHDWDLGVRPDGLESTKAKLLRPHIEQSKQWNILKSLTAPDSVGIVLAQKVLK